MINLKQLLIEGVYDKGILKAVFMAGGPGSGKSYVASQLFGIPKKINVSVSGLKTVNSDTEFEALLRKYGFETFGTGKLDIDKWPDEVFDAIAGGEEAVWIASLTFVVVVTRRALGAKALSEF